MQAKRIAIRFFIFACIGLLLEVFYTAGIQLMNGNWNMHGSSSPWMMIDYGLLGIVTMWLARPMIARGVPLPARAVVYMLGIYIVEYVSGIIFTQVFGLRIWDYSSIPYNLHGQIMLLSAPFWYALGLGIELLYRWVDTCALVLVRGVTREQIEAMEG
jgi:uncharacterized membrane protein